MNVDRFWKLIWMGRQKSIGEGLNELWEKNSNLNNIKNELKKNLFLTGF